MAKPIDEIEFKELAPTLKALAKAGATTEHADWIRKGENAARLIALISERHGVVESHFRVQVSYAPLPGVAALEKKFSKDGVSEIFDGRIWERHSSCAKIDETPGERIFHLVSVPEVYVQLNIADVWDELAAYFGKKGRRFAIETEAVEFAGAEPWLQREDTILALGSWALNENESRSVAWLEEDDGRRLSDMPVGDQFCEGDLLLLVSVPD